MAILAERVIQSPAACPVFGAEDLEFWSLRRWPWSLSLRASLGVYVLVLVLLMCFFCEWMRFVQDMSVVSSMSCLPKSSSAA